jgi:hypothetical protein
MPGVEAILPRLLSGALITCKKGPNVMEKIHLFPGCLQNISAVKRTGNLFNSQCHI